MTEIANIPYFKLLGTVWEVLRAPKIALYGLKFMFFTFLSVLIEFPIMENP